MATSPEEFGTASPFATGLRNEQNHVVETLKSIKVPIEVGGNTCIFYYRDLLDAGVVA